MDKKKLTKSAVSFRAIKNWSHEDRPREKLITKGKAALTDAELLGIIIGSGSPKISAVALMQQVLLDCEQDLNILGRKSVEELMRYKGIGEAKAVAIAATLELGKRKQASKSKSRQQITSSKAAFHIIQGDLMDLNHEEFWILALSRSSHLIRKEKISSGGIASTVVDPKVVFKKALDLRASSIILAHNHPSGNLKPSNQDFGLTHQLIQAGKVLEILVHDHIIVGGNNYYSFADEGKM